MQPKALLIGLGGIGENVYLPQLKKINYDITTVDKFNENAQFESIEDIDKTFDVCIISTPNFTHHEYAKSVADICKHVFIEKPGLPSADQWQELCDSFPNTRFYMCKNNLYRNEYGALGNFLKNVESPVSVEINWLNKDRIPSPGSWFTNRKQSWGGVAMDLFPHLYCYMSMLFPIHKLQRTAHSMCQQNSLVELMYSGSTTAYGKIDPKGIYDVCDYAQETWMYNNVPITITASWRAGIDDQSIRIHTHESTYEWRFGLCPDIAYGKMIAECTQENYKQHQELDYWIHKSLEVYHEG